MNKITINTMNKKWKIGTLGFLLLSVLLIGSCSSSSLEGTYVGKGKLLLKNDGYTEPKGDESNMTLNITKESSDFFLHISDKETSAECILNIRPNSGSSIVFISSVPTKICKLGVEGVSYELDDYSISGTGTQLDGEIEFKIPFYAQTDRKNKPEFEFEFEGKRTK